MTHVPTGMTYVGQRKVPKGKTIETDSYHGSGLVWARIYKAHPDECVKEILETCATSEEADEAEKRHIELCRQQYGELCVNIADGGQGGDTRTGTNHTEEAKRKIGLASKGRVPWNKGNHLPEETRQKISQAKMGQVVSEETRQYFSEKFKGDGNPFYGKHHSKEQREKWSRERRGWTHTDEARKKMSESRKGRVPWNKGKTLSEEHKRKMSEGLKRTLRQKRANREI